MARRTFPRVTLTATGGRLGGAKVGVYTDADRTTLADLRTTSQGALASVQQVDAGGELIGDEFLGPDDDADTLYLGLTPGQGFQTPPTFTPNTVAAVDESAPPTDLLLQSPDSTWYRLVVANDGTLSTEAVV